MPYNSDLRLRKYLRRRKALSPQTAIEITDETFKDLGWLNIPGKNSVDQALGKTSLDKINPYRLTEDGKYWFDEEVFRKTNKLNYILLALILLALITCIGMIIFVAILGSTIGVQS